MNAGVRLSAALRALRSKRETNGDVHVDRTDVRRKVRLVVDVEASTQLRHHLPRRAHVLALDQPRVTLFVSILEHPFARDDAREVVEQPRLAGDDDGEETVGREQALDLFERAREKRQVLEDVN